MATQHNDPIATEIFESALFTQLLGVTAGLFGFIVFLLANLDTTVKDSLKLLLLKGWPIYVTYGFTFITLAVWLLWKSARCWATPQAALKYIYYVFICADIVLLGCLVWSTGGVKNSIFMPIFLLIPATATCFCSPQRRFFWFVTAGTIVVFLVLSFFGPISLGIPPNLSTAEMTCFVLLNILGIGTAATCYFSTHRIRSRYCKDDLGHSDNCQSLIL